jgi:hypothetical protein
MHVAARWRALRSLTPIGKSFIRSDFRRAPLPEHGAWVDQQRK